MLRPENTVKLLFRIVYPVSVRPMGPYTGTEMPYDPPKKEKLDRKNILSNCSNFFPLNSDRVYVRQDPVHCLNHT